MVAHRDSTVFINVQATKVNLALRPWQWTTSLDCGGRLRGSRRKSGVAMLIKFLTHFNLDAAAGRTKRSRAALEEDKGCTCGRKIKSRNEFACGNTDEGQHSRCPCARRGKLCTEKCRCRHCINTQSEIKAAEKSKGCRCGEDKYRRTKDVAFVSCADVQGKRMTKCPCYSDGKGCDMKCRCVNCGNSFGASNRPFRIPQPRIPGPKEPKIIGCRCGEERRNKDPWFVACFDVKGQRASRCPCYRGGVGCEEYCKCVNCRNCYNASDQADETPVSRVPRLSTISGSTISDLEISHSEEMSLWKKQQIRYSTRPHFSDGGVTMCINYPKHTISSYLIRPTATILYRTLINKTQNKTQPGFV